MKVLVTPTLLNNKEPIYIPPSKSLSHRSIIAASLADGISRIDNIEYSDDINATISGMRKIGAKIETYDKYLIIQGVSNQLNFSRCEVVVGESASTLRFLIPLFALKETNTIFIGKESLLKRPMGVYQKIFDNQQLMFRIDKQHISIYGGLKAGIFNLPGNVSSQFITGLLFALPLLEEDSKIIIEDKIESLSYIKMSIDILRKYGIIVNMEENIIYIQGKQKYQAYNYSVEGDYSQFAFFAVLGALNNGITCLNLNHNSLQGDRAIVNILKKLDVKINEIENGYEIKQSDIGSGSFDISDSIDLAPILCVLGMYSKDIIYLTNAHRLEFKESNRKERMVEELKKLNVDIQCNEDTISIKGGELYRFNEPLNPNGDHRLFMSFVIAALTLENSSVIIDAQCMNKSFPSFIQKLKSLGANIEYL